MKTCRNHSNETTEHIHKQQNKGENRTGDVCKILTLNTSLEMSKADVHIFYLLVLSVLCKS